MLREPPSKYDSLVAYVILITVQEYFSTWLETPQGFEIN